VFDFASSPGNLSFVPSTVLAVIVAQLGCRRPPSGKEPPLVGQRTTLPAALSIIQPQDNGYLENCPTIARGHSRPSVRLSKSSSCPIIRRCISQSSVSRLPASSLISSINPSTLQASCRRRCRAECSEPLQTSASRAQALKTLLQLSASRLCSQWQCTR
jgi:hypothetical protein